MYGIYPNVLRIIFRVKKKNNCLGESPSVGETAHSLFKNHQSLFGFEFWIIRFTFYSLQNVGLKNVSHYIWVISETRLPQNRWFIMENPLKTDDLGVFGGIWGYSF